MKKTILLALAMLPASLAASAKTLIVYYSFTNNVHTIATELQAQTGADMVRVEPAEKSLDYAANNYAIGSALISAIRNNPDDPAAYPAIDPVDVNLDDYNVILIGAPLWWSNMAAPLQTYLFQNRSRLADKKIGLIVSSASSGISGVEADLRRLVPAGDFVSPSLWIRSAQTGNCRSLIASWLTQIGYSTLSVGTVASDGAPSINIGQGLIHVDGDFNSLSLYSLSGQKVLETTARTVSTSTLAAGLYIAHLESRNGLTTRKIAVY